MEFKKKVINKAMRKLKQIKTLIAAPAMGKTHAVISHLSVSNDRAVIACKSISLLNQTLKDLNDKAVPVIGIHSGNTVGSVGSSIEQALRSDVPVILCTHDGLFAIKNKDNCHGRDLYIDEVPSIAKFAHLEIEPVDLCMSEWELVEDKPKIAKYKLNTSKAIEIQRRVKNKLENHNLKIFSEEYYGLMTALSEGQVVYVDKESNNVNYIKCIPVDDWFLKFSSVTIMAANLSDTMEGKLLEHLYNYQFIDSELILSRSGYSNLNRVTLYPLLKQGNYSRYLENTPCGDGDMFGALQRQALSIVGDDKYIYTVNKDNQKANNEGWENGTLVPYNPHGRNDLMNYTNVIALFRYNPNSQNAKMLRAFGESIGVGCELYDAYITSKYLEPIFQLLTRSDIRDMNGRKECKFVVPDARIANYLINGWLKGVVVDCSYAISAPVIEKKASRKDINHRIWNAELVNLYEQDPLISSRRAANEMFLRLGDDAPKYRTCSTLLTRIKQDIAA